MAIQIVRFITDIFLINITFFLSFIIRYGTNIPQYNFVSYKDSFVLLTLVYILALAFTKVFKKAFRSFWELFRNIFVGFLLGTLLGIVLMYIFRANWMSFPTSVFIISLPVGVSLVFLVNCMILRMARKIKKRVVILGKEAPLMAPEQSPYIETRHIDNIEQLLHLKDVDEIVINRRIEEHKQFNFLIYLLLKLKVNVVFSPALYAELLSDSMMGKNSLQFLTTFIGRKSDTEEFLIRVLDITGSVFLLFVLGPLIGLIALLIKLTSAGPVFYKQTRVSKDGKTFSLYKFRTMRKDAEKESGPVLAEKEDKRVTKIGRFLRNTRMDEIPQLLNVIQGDMSLVGPRPERPHFVKQHKVLRQARLAVKPGLTGLAQIRSHYDLRPKHKTKYDYLYIQRRSLLLNLYILVKTIPIVFLKKGQ